MKATIQAAIDSHLAWTEAFQSAIDLKIISETVALSAYDDMCPFGKWLYSQADEVKRCPAYRRVKDLHYRFHAEAGEIVRLMKTARFGDAKAQLAGDYAAISAQLLSALHDWQTEKSA